MLHQRGKTYAQDLRERVFAASDGGMRVGQIAARLLVSVSYVSKVLTCRRLSGERTARPQRCHVPAKLAAHHEAIRERVRGRDDRRTAGLAAGYSPGLGQCGADGENPGRARSDAQKRPCTRPNRTAPMSPRPARHGAPLSPN